MIIKNIIKDTILEYLNEEELFSDINLNNKFYKWFGNSIVIDKNRNPMICYHGTANGGFNEFKPKIGYKGKSKQQVDLGSHFSIDKEYSSGYAGKGKKSRIYDCFLRIESPLYTNQMIWREDDEEMFSIYLNFITKLFNIKLRGDHYYDKNGNKHNEPQIIGLNSFDIDKIPSNKLFNGLLSFGFDGIVHEPYNMVGMDYIKKHPTAYIVLSSNQVKSIENDGSWDVDDNNIYS